MKTYIKTGMTGGCALLLACCALPIASRAARGPNIVVIIADDLGYSDVSYNPYAGPEVSTPNIDKLIRGGVWFSNGYVTGNICAPSRTGFFLGCYQQRIGAHNESDVNNKITPNHTIIPQFLKNPNDGVDDYVCKAVGKWHMGRDKNAKCSIDGNGDGDYIDLEDYGTIPLSEFAFNPLVRGFDYFYGFVYLGGNDYFNYGEHCFKDNYRFKMGDPIDGISDGDDVKTYYTTRFTDEACSFIETQAATNKPFFLHLAYNAVHTPMQAPVSPAGIAEGAPGWFPDAAWFNARYPDMWKSPAYYDPASPAEKQANRAILMAMLYHMDVGIGRVMDTLKAKGIWDNTLIFFFSDNGGALASVASNNPLREQKHTNYEGGIRVPFALSWPAGLGSRTNIVIDAPVISIDILPTMLEAAGITPTNGFKQFDGRSLLPLIRGEVTSLHDYLYWSEGQIDYEYAIRAGDWKLYINHDTNELYNLTDDIGETNDLAAVYPDKVRALRQEHFRWMTEMATASKDDLEARLWNFESAPPTVNYANLITDDFTYSPGNLDTQSGGSGWSNSWKGTMVLVTNSLQFSSTNYVNKSAGARPGNDDVDVSDYISTRNFSQSLTGTVWVSFLSSFDPGMVASGGPAANAWQALLINGNPSNSLTIFGGNNNDWSGMYDGAAAKNRSNVVTRLVATKSIFTDQHATYLHIVKFESNVSGSNDRVTWYATKNTAGLTGQTVAALDAAVSAGTMSKVTATSTDGDWWGNALSSIGLEVKNQSDSVLADMSFDNLRIAYGLDDNAMVKAVVTGQTSTVLPLPAALTMRGAKIDSDKFSIEYDQKVGWLPTGAHFEIKHSLSDPVWTTVTPSTSSLVDRYSDVQTYCATFGIDSSNLFVRVSE